MKLRLLISSLVMLVAISSTTGCDDQAVVEETQEVYFEVSYSNNAWVPQFRGFLINKEGKILTFDKPAKWNHHEDNELTAQQLAANLSETTLSTVTIPVAEFKNFSSKVETVGDPDFSKPVQVGADGGVTSFYAYIFDADKQRYKVILLKQTGDVQVQNNDKTAIDMAAWLGQIVEKVY